MDEIASAYNLSSGKAQLIHQITQQNTYYTAEELASMSINELNLISMSGGLTLENVSANGTASDKAYIGEDAAKKAALTHAGVEESAITHYEIEIDWEKGVMVYDVEFDADGTEYDYDINAATGEVVKYDNKREDGYKEFGTSTGTGAAAPVISEDAAKQAAYTHAGINEADVLHSHAKIDREHGMFVYEIEFRTETYEYDYDINATTGEVVKYEREAEYSVQKMLDYINEVNGSIAKDSQEILDKTTEYFTEADVLNSALTHAGVKAEDAYDISVELDQEHGKTVYEVEFKSGSWEFEYEINASSGEIMNFDKEQDD